MATTVNVNVKRLAERLDFVALGSFVIPFVIYVITVCPTVAILDSAELTTAAVSLGLTRATGYPLYILLGYLWSRLPIGNFALRMNLFSALNGALTIWLTYHVLKKLAIPRWAALISLGLLATSPFFWGLSLVAEVYTLHTLLLAGTIFLALNWLESPSLLHTFWLFLIVGLSLSNHVSSLLTLPGLGLVLLVKKPRTLLKPRVIIFAALGILAGLLPYLYLPLRYTARPAFNYAGIFDATGLFYPVNLHSFKGVWWIASGKVFSTRVGDNWRILDQTLMVFIRGLWRSFFGLGIGPGLYGLYLMLKRHKWEAIFLIITFLINLAFFTTYRVIDLETMFLPIYLIFAIWLAYGLKGLHQLFLEINRKPLLVISDGRNFTGADLFRGAMALFLVFVTIWNWPLVSQANNWEGHDKAQAIFQQLEPNAIVYGKWTTIPILQYYQIVEGQRSDVLLVNRFLISPENIELWMENEIRKEIRPVYIDYLTPSLVEHFEFGEANPLYQVIN